MLKTAMLLGILTTLCAGLSGCGQKGDLYMPERSQVALMSVQPSEL